MATNEQRFAALGLEAELPIAGTGVLLCYAPAALRLRVPRS